MPRNEAETRADLIDPLLNSLGWKGSSFINREYYFTKGKINIEGDKIKRGDPKKADYLLKYNNIPIAVIEAKDESQSAGAGIQQAVDYADTLDLKFAFSTNGKEIEEFSFITNQYRTISIYPTPDELWSKLQDYNKLTTDVSKLLEAPYYTTENKKPRYYQEVAIRRTISAIANGRKRNLLNLATGTGKTFIAFQIAWKLKQAGKANRILFLADRNVLTEQAYNAFEPFGNARDYIREGETPTEREVYFSIYQAMYAEKDGKRVYEHYPENFFDLIIIDECHRSGFGSWNNILNHFSSAVQLGMTATPKESDNINTYKYFGKEEEGYKALYEYSMATGIDDGFLANFLIHRFKLSTDAQNLIVDEVVEGGAEVEVPDGSELKDVYGAKQYELDVTLPDRTKAMCDKLASILKQTGEMQKTIVFCVTMDHARDVAKHMQNHFSHLGFNNYAVRIVSEETNAESLLKTFQRENTERPVVATTVDLLSTGFDAPSVKNIVFMKYINSSIIFKQILGRGSRISEDMGKYFFRIIDFTNSTRLLDEWTAGAPNVTHPKSGTNVICGVVHDRDTNLPIHGARAVAQLSPNQQSVTLTNEHGQFEFVNLPDGEIIISVSANKFRNKQKKILTSIDCVEPTLFDLVKQGPQVKPIKITGLTVEFQEEAIFEVQITGERLTLNEYIDYTKNKINEKFNNEEALRETWADPNSRKATVRDLQVQGINAEIIAKATNQPEADDFDLLANIAFNKPIHTRQERAEALKNLEQQFINSFNEEQKLIIQSLLIYYQLNGIKELDKSEVFDLFLPRGVQDAKDKFGSIPLLKSALGNLQRLLYKQ